MRKSIIAVSMLFALVSCSESTSIDSLKEISVNAVNCIETKGYVVGDTLYEKDTDAPRDIHLSAYNSSLSQPFFLDETFKNVTGSAWTNYRGEVHSPLYWPQDKIINFLAYSTGYSSPKAAWSLSESSSKVVLTVTPDSIQDDILYAAVSDCKSDSSPVLMEFQHSQAWLEFQVFAPKTELTTFLGVTIEDVYTSGTLTIADDYTNVHSSWDFSMSAPTEYMIAPDIDAYISSPTSISLSMLVPQQPRCDMVFHFRINGVDKSYRCDLKDSGYWFSSIHYNYMINVIGGEIMGLSKSATDDVDIECNVTLVETEW